MANKIRPLKRQSLPNSILLPEELNRQSKIGQQTSKKHLNFKIKQDKRSIRPTSLLLSQQLHERTIINVQRIALHL